MRVHWHRRDLRIADNPALCSDGNPIVGLFVLDPEVMNFAGEPRIQFLYDALRKLRRAYRGSGGELYIRKGDPCDIIPEFLDAHQCSVVSWEADYSGLASRRDKTVQQKLIESDTSVNIVDGAVLHAPGAILTTTGSRYQVFSYFGKSWMTREKPHPVDPPTAFAEDSARSGEIPSHQGLDDTNIPAAGTDWARRRLNSFCEGDIYEYPTRRDRPADRGTSRLSQDLSFGTIGIREVWETTERASAQANSEEDRDAVSEFQRQLAWREFYMDTLDRCPGMLNTSLVDFENPITWRDDPPSLEAWKLGQTGFPFVDAGMRQLREEAYLPNRVRMIVASFLTKDLLIDWRDGYRWFRERLVDHDPANNAGGWQWAASTGTDAQPYFRIFNPVTQGERYDPDGTYISRYVEELDHVPAAVIHDWTDISPEERRNHAPAYVDPIIDHEARREEALAVFRRASGNR